MRFLNVFLLLVVVGFHQANADGINTALEYRESDIGIDYRAIAKPPLDVMLSHGEVEFFENATSVFGDETAKAWREMSAEIGTGLVAVYTIEGMKEFTPSMLSDLADIGHRHPHYGRLSSEGSLFRSEQFLSRISE